MPEKYDPSIDVHAVHLLSFCAYHYIIKYLSFQGKENARGEEPLTDYLLRSTFFRIPGISSYFSVFRLAFEVLKKRAEIVRLRLHPDNPADAFHKLSFPGFLLKEDR